MLATIALFEVKKRLSMISTYLYFGIFFALAFFFEIAAGGAFKSVSVGMGAGGKVFADSPYTLGQLISVCSYFGLLIIAAVSGQAVHQDYETSSSPFFFTAPIAKRDYLFGRFLGAWLVLALIFTSLGLGLGLGAKMPFLEPLLITGHPGVWPLVQPYLVSVWPNLFFLGAVFFTLATLGRRMMPVYVGAVVLLIGYLIAQSLTAKIENRTIVAILDPFGGQALDRVTEYWSIAEKNTRVIPLEGVLLYNRLLFVAAGAVLLGIAYVRFSFTLGGEKTKAAAALPEEAPPAAAPLPTALAQPGAAPFSLFARQTLLAFEETVKNIYFVVILLAGVLFMVFVTSTAGAVFGTTTYPVTYQMIELTSGTFSLFMIILITFYSGELTWRERDARVDQLIDAMPVPGWLQFTSKLAALMLVQVVLMAVVMISGLLIQTFKGYFHYEVGLYLKELFGLSLVRWWTLCVLAMLVQAIVNEKYIGHFVMVLYYIATAFLGRLGFEHNLYKFGAAPAHTYSDMNRFGPFIRPIVWFDAYWAALALALAVASNLLWVRGLETSPASRWRLFRQRLRAPSIATLTVSLALFAGIGAYLFYNTNILNRYTTQYERENEQAEYEKTYKIYETKPQPRVTAVSVAVDLYPERRAANVTGTYTVLNLSAEPISSVIVTLPTESKLSTLTIAGQPEASLNARLGVHVFELKPPLAPGASAPLHFALSMEPRGFKNQGQDTFVAENGTFFNNTLLPIIGYADTAELAEDSVRKKHGFQPKERMADLNDQAARRNTYINRDADWTTFEATVSTSKDQIAIAPGTLQSDTTEGDRRTFKYRMDGKVLHFFSVLSARYSVLKDKWNDVDLAIYYQPGHEYNLARMMKAIKASLDYFTKNFGPYQHKQVRILEFPRYAQFAQSFANTIPYSEAIGFIAKVDPKDEEDIDYPYYVTAHEVAHQWWAHQVVGANVQGATVLSETLAQYSALMVMKAEYGENKMRRFLRYELQRYLIGRSLERKKELPLSRVENQQYVHYSKGSLVMYALQDYMGEAKVNEALAALIKKWAFKGPPYPTSLDLTAELKARATPEERRLIEDLFDHITLWDNRATAATATKRPDGKYEVKIEVLAKKLRAGELGVQTDEPIDDLVDVGTVDSKGDALHIEKRQLKGEKAEFTMVVDTLPAKAGIDPLNKLVDRKPDDNVVAVVVK